MRPVRTKPRLVPVLDVMNGQVVRAVGGRRKEYRPIVSQLTAATTPVAVAKALLTATGAAELYVADLDAIAGSGRIAPSVLELFEVCPVPVWLDAGIGQNLSIAAVPALSHIRPVIGSETCDSPETLFHTLVEAGERKVAFSIDMKHGRLLGHSPAWVEHGVFSDADVLEMAAVVVEHMGVRTLILIDLADVGEKAGPTGTEYWCQKIASRMPNMELIVGGGIRNGDDIERLGEAGATAILVASALHDGALKL